MIDHCEVSEARIVDLPRLLRGISESEVTKRQKRCRELFKATIGWFDPSLSVTNLSLSHKVVMASPSFWTAMKVWSARIEGAFLVEKRKKELEQWQ